MKKALSFMLALMCAMTCLCGASMAEEPVSFSIAFPDNPTMPFTEDWLSVKESTAFANANVTWEVYPNTDYNTKLTMALSTGTAPDVMLNITSQNNPYNQLAQNGALLPINQYLDYLPNFKQYVETYGLQQEIDQIMVMLDGNYYHMPLAYSELIVNAGMLVRTDLMEKYGIEQIRTFDDLYAFLKAHKEANPGSYPFTVYQNMSNLFNYSLPCWGLSMGSGSSSGSYVLSYDYDTKTYFAGAITDEYKDYLGYFAKLYAEGLIDPEFASTPADQWSSKLATGSAVASYGWDDMIGSILANATDENASLVMLPPLEGPKGAYWQPNSLVRSGIAISAKILDRKDWQDVLATVDKMFFAPEMFEMFAIGKEGVTFTRGEDGSIQYSEELLNAPEGLYKGLQMRYGCGLWAMLMLWEKPIQMTKYSEAFRETNEKALEMNALLSLPLVPKFDEADTEYMSILLATLSDTFETWTNDFITGKKSLDTDWAAYVAEMESKGIENLKDLYNQRLAEQFGD